MWNQLELYYGIYRMFLKCEFVNIIIDKSFFYLEYIDSHIENEKK